jgi:hypothetical protein
MLIREASSESEHDQLMIECASDQGIRKICKAIDSKGTFRDNINFSVEVLCRDGRYTVGYADLVIYDPYKNKSTSSYILVEAKPTLYDLGGTLRQVKSYRRFLFFKYDYRGIGEYLVENIGTAIVTRSHPSPEVERLCANEGVKVITFNRDN